MREAFRGEYGYTGNNVLLFAEATNYLIYKAYDVLLDKAIAEGKNSLVIISGVPASGKSFARNDPQIRESGILDFSDKGVIFDSAFTKIEAYDEAISRAVEKGIPLSNITVVAIYNDPRTGYNNSIERGKAIGRFLSIKYFLDLTFSANVGKLEKLLNKYASSKNTSENINFIAIDNSHNIPKLVSAEDALNWDFEVDDELVHDLLTLIKEKYERGELTREQLSYVIGGVHTLETLADPRNKEIADGLARQVDGDALKDNRRLQGGVRDRGLRLEYPNTSGGSQYSISSFGASLNSLYGAKNTPSKNSMLIGIAVEDKLKDKIYAPEHYENLAKMLGSKLTGEEVLTARDSYLENKTEKDIKSLKRNPTFRTIARDFERGAIENLATDIITKGVLQGIALNENVEQAKQKALNNVVDSLRGLTNEQWQKQSGIDFVSTILNIPVVWRHKVGSEEDKEDKLKLINKWNLVTGPLTPEEQAVFDAEQSRLNSLADIILTEFNLLRDAANEKRRQRAAIQRERVENYRATPREEDSTDRMLREMAEDNWINKPRAEFDIPIELLQKHQFGVNDIGEMFILFKVSFARYLVAKGMAENSETAFDNKVNLVEFAKSMQNILFSLCDEMLDPITSPKAFVRVNKIIASIPTGERVSMKTLQQRSVIALHRLHRSGIKDLKKHLINNLIKDIKHFAIKGSSLDQTMSDLKRKVSGKLEQEARWIIEFVQMSKNAVARAKEEYVICVERVLCF